jgi:hypothetical protein
MTKQNKIPQDEISTKTLVKEALSNLKGHSPEYEPHDCPWKNTDKEDWLTSRLSKMWISIVSVFLGIVVSLVVWGSSINSDIATAKVEKEYIVKKLDQQDEKLSKILDIIINKNNTISYNVRDEK